jgi:hypothetical protein
MVGDIHNISFDYDTQRNVPKLAAGRKTFGYRARKVVSYQCAFKPVKAGKHLLQEGLHGLTSL